MMENLSLRSRDRSWRDVMLALPVILVLAFTADAQVRTGGKGGGLPTGGPGPGGGPGSSTGGRTLPDLPSLYHVLDRITYGATDEHVELARHLGIEAFIRLQLDPALITESLELENALASLPSPYTAVGDPQWDWNSLYTDYIWRARYSNRQLQEVMTEFWSNHFDTGLTTGNGGAAGFFSSLHFNPAGQATIAYWDSAANRPMLAEWNGSVWTQTRIDDQRGNGYYISLDYDPSGAPSEPAASYWSSSDFELQLARRVGGTWQNETVDPGIFAAYTSLEFDSAGNPVIAYVKYDLVGDQAVNGELRVARWNGGWVIDVVDGPGALGVGWYASLALDGSGNPSVSYFDGDAGVLKYAEWNGTAWDVAVVDSTAGVGSWTSLEHTPAGEPAISYYDGTNQQLLYVEKNGNNWRAPQIVDVGGVGEHTSLDFDPGSGDPVISYFDRANYDLKVARWNSGTSMWDVQPAISTLNIEGEWNSLAFDAAGEAVISYYNGSQFDLRLAQGSGPSSWSSRLVYGRGTSRFRYTDWEMLETEAFRANAFGKFHDLLRVSATSAAMMLFLNNNENIATNVNENYGRELLELHTVGVDGGYDQDDVLEASKVMTGWGIDQGLRCSISIGDFCYTHQQHLAGDRTVMGQSFPDDSAPGREMEQGDALLQFLGAHPSTAEFMCGKLLQKFVADIPPTGLFGRCRATWTRSGGDIGKVLETILFSPEFLGSDNQLNKVRTPFEYSLAAARHLDATADGLSLWFDISEQGMPLFRYDIPTGWPEEGVAWISTNSFLKRWQFADDLTHDNRGTVIDPQTMVTTRGIFSAEGVIEFFVQRLLRGQANPVVMADFLDCLTAGNPGWRADDPGADNQIRDMLGVMLGLPVYHKQ